MDKTRKAFFTIYFHVTLVIFIAIGVSLYINWESLEPIYRISHILLMILILHTYEENKFPGGFGWAFNTIKKSEYPDRYPMDRFIATLVEGIAVATMLIALIFFMNPITAAAFAMFGFAETLVHIGIGITFLKKFRSKGKDTIYMPGSATTWFGFAPAGCIMFYELASNNLLTPLQWAIAIGITLAYDIIFIILPENLLKNPNSPHHYDSANLLGYFKKYLD